MTRETEDANLSPFLRVCREEWSRLRATAPLTLTERDLSPSGTKRPGRLAIRPAFHSIRHRFEGRGRHPYVAGKRVLDQVDGVEDQDDKNGQ